MFSAIIILSYSQIYENFFMMRLRYKEYSHAGCDALRRFHSHSSRDPESGRTLVHDLRKREIFAWFDDIELYPSDSPNKQIS